MLTYLLYTIPSFLFVLTLVVTIHELGHFWAARSFGVAVDRFSIGFGRAIAQWTDRSGVEWRIGWLPLGGYVKFSGDDNAASVPDAESLADLKSEIARSEGEAAVSRYFHFKPLWQRAIVVAAGPFANFILAVVLFAALLMALGEQQRPARVDGVQPGSAAAAAGFRPGDVVLKADGRRIDDFAELSQVIMLRAGAETDFVVRREGEELTLVATPVRKVVQDRIAGETRMGQLGIENRPTPEELQIRRQGPVKALAGGVRRTWNVLDTTVYYLGRIVRGQEKPDQLGGPLRIASTSGKVAQVSAEGAPSPFWMVLGALVGLLQLAAVLSVGIGFMNLLPVPVLDGGHLLFYAYEAVARRPLAAQVQAAGYRVGLALLLCLMLFATWNDLQQLRVFKFLGDLLS